jgi:predicted ABC-type ATPase
MIAGPNGAGKTTVSRELLTCSLEIDEYMNADEIAKGLAPMHSEMMALMAGKLMVKRLRDLLERGNSFAFETTGAGHNYLRYLNLAKEAGYEVNLFFLRLENPEQAVHRVAERVKQGGHHIPDETVSRRFYAGLKNLIELYLPICDRAVIVDNSSKKTIGKLIARKNENGDLEILEPKIWERIKEVSDG